MLLLLQCMNGDSASLKTSSEQHCSQRYFRQNAARARADARASLTHFSSRIRKGHNGAVLIGHIMTVSSLCAHTQATCTMQIQCHTSEAQGMRPTMEDAATADEVSPERTITTPPRDSSAPRVHLTLSTFQDFAKHYAFYAVFDGHGDHLFLWPHERHCDATVSRSQGP